MTTIANLEDQLDAHKVRERVDIVNGDGETTSFKRRARLHQALWRERNGIPVGTQPTKPTKDARPLGSRIEFAYGMETGKNFLGDPVRKAVASRLANPEKHQTLKTDRLYCDLLSSMPMCFNLFGWLQGDVEAATKAVRTWWPDAPGNVANMRFEWSPGRLDPKFLGNRSAFDVAFELAGGKGSGIIGIETKYHEHAKKEARPEPSRLRRYKQVSERAGIFAPDALDAILGTDLQQIWLDHLLVLSMLQHPSGKWTWGRFVLVYPEQNASFKDAAARYKALLRNASTFEARPLASMLKAEALPGKAISAFRDRYLW